MATVDVPSELLASLKEFRMAKQTSLTKDQPASAFVISIDKTKLVLQEEERHEPIALEDLVEELPENAPRFIVLSYRLEHADGRLSFPLVLLYWAPPTSHTTQSTLYASALSNFSTACDVGKVIDIREGADLSDKFLKSKLGA
ncbi:unnamed protein product [Tilletia controversa]|uniref:ADF-H domain-containing protein n=3 Tax=Tilletia TaxID=13289 RepID=A0A8X7MVU4_9BASI|nr:hypothetical protein CF335_g5399 [Tilletia laevis]KAE8201328.1 hypothetical protein CF328_g2701 [Tilletia controversa]KAE8264609.1 hypothetical protein A4X03_0g830 [Tilletia caries]KAE8199436.1 hypothetical protein CF336_g1195 [Tilletia laevis]KAE8249180.1 hypothetical protein A4X06_0g3341 [Tilletia controversa]